MKKGGGERVSIIGLGNNKEARTNMYSHSQRLESWIAVGYGIIKIWHVRARTSNLYIGGKERIRIVINSSE